MPMIKRCQLWLVEALGNCDHCRVDESKCQVGVLIAERARPDIVLRKQILHDKLATFDILEKRVIGRQPEPADNEPLKLNHDRGRYDQPFRRALDQFRTPGVRPVVGVNQRIQNAGVADQRHERGSN